MANTFSFLVQVLSRTPTDCQGCSVATSDGSNSSRIRQSNLREEQSDTNTTGRLDGSRDHVDQPLSHTRQSEEHEDEPFDKHSGQGKLVRDVSGTVPADDLVSEVGVESHSWSTLPLALRSSW